MGREVSIGNYKFPEIKTLFDVSHNSVYFLGTYSFLYAKWSSGGKQKTGLEDGQPTRNKINRVKKAEEKDPSVKNSKKRKTDNKYPKTNAGVPSEGVEYPMRI